MHAKKNVHSDSYWLNDVAEQNWKSPTTATATATAKAPAASTDDVKEFHRHANRVENFSAR